MPERPVAAEKPLSSQIGRTIFAKKSSISDRHTAVRNEVQRSLDEHSRIVVVPEFGLTPAGHISKVEDDFRVLSAHADADNFLFAGTRHEGQYNRGLAFSKRYGQRQQSIHWHYKAASAKGHGENVLGPSEKGVYHCPSATKIGADEVLIAIGICYDAYDPTTFLNLCIAGVRDRMAPISRIILIPSSNSSPDFVALLRDLSFLARCAVVYVNALHGDAAMFMCGYDVEEFFENSPSHVCNNRRSKKHATEGFTPEQAWVWVLQTISSHSTKNRISWTH